MLASHVTGWPDFLLRTDGRQEMVSCPKNSPTRLRLDLYDASAVLNRCSFFAEPHDLTGCPIFTASTAARATSGTLKKAPRWRFRLQTRRPGWNKPKALRSASPPSGACHLSEHHGQPNHGPRCPSLAPVSTVVSVIAISWLKTIAFRVSARQPAIYAKARRWTIPGSIVIEGRRNSWISVMWISVMCAADVMRSLALVRGRR